MRAKCIENKMRNGNYKVGEIYDIKYVNKKYRIQSEWRIFIETDKEIEDALIKRKDNFNFAFCEFEFIK